MLISYAHAQQAAGQAAQASAGLMDFMPFLVMAGVLWFLMVRPAMKRNKEQAAMVSGLQVGDEIVTQAGMAGRIAKLGTNYLELEVARIKDQPVNVVVQKQAIAIVLPKGSLESL